MANAPKILVYLTPGSGQSPVELSAYLSQETNATITSTIENPVETSSFTTGDLSLKGYDPTGTVQALFANIQPWSTDFLVAVDLGIWNDATSSYRYDVIMLGFVAPSTLQFDLREKSFAFTVIGQSRALQTTSAAGLFQRTGYTAKTWYLQQDATPQDPTIRVTTPSTSSPCPFQAGDLIQLGDGGEQRTVTGVAADSTTSPPAYWMLWLNQGLKEKYPSLTFINLLTPYQRNVSLHDAVSTLFAAAGFTTEEYFGSASLPNLGTLFATPVNTTGLPSGPVTGISPGLQNPGQQLKIFAGAIDGIYQANDATSGWTKLVSYKLPPVDRTNAAGAYIFTGYKRTKTRLTAPRYGLNITMKFFGYDFYNAQFGLYYRYVLTVTCNADVAGTVFTFTTSLDREKYDTPSDSWGNSINMWAGVTSTTTTDLSALYDAIGIEVNPADGAVYFTDLQNVSGGGTAITMNTSVYTPSLGYLANKATGVNGPITFTYPNRCVVTQLDGTLGQPPRIFAYSVAPDGTMTLQGIWNSSPYLIGRSIRRNDGDGRYYGLLSDPTNGISLISWRDSYLTPDATTLSPTLLLPSPFGSAQSTSLLGRPYEVDLICVQTAGGPGTGTYPMYALVGGTPHYISSAGSGVIPYMDTSDLSVADALGQLTVLNAGIFFLGSGDTAWQFRTRSSPMPGNTIGTNDQIDGDAGFLVPKTQPVFNRWVGYVRVENESDKTIFGEAGDPAWADTDFGLKLSSRYVSVSSFARALATSLYNYLGSKKRYIEVERLRDGIRIYKPGRTFHCVVDGVNRQFQIIETQIPVNGITVKVVGLEV